METEQLKQHLKEQIISFLNIPSVTAAEIRDDEPLFGEGLGLDSIDSLELIVLLNREYGYTIKIRNRLGRSKGKTQRGQRLSYRRRSCLPSRT